MAINIRPQPSKKRLISVLGGAVIALIVSLLTIAWVASSLYTKGETSAIDASYTAFIDSRIKQLPEVQTFFHQHQNVTTKVYYLNRGGAQYAFDSSLPDVHLAKGIVQGIELNINVDYIPTPRDIQSGHQRQIGDYYFSATFYCSPVSLQNASQSWFPNDINQKSSALCPSERNALNSPFIQ